MVWIFVVNVKYTNLMVAHTDIRGFNIIIIIRIIIISIIAIIMHKTICIIIIIIRNLYSAIMPLGGYRGAGGTGR